MNVKSLRLKKVMTQHQLAQKMEVDQTAISQWETGESLPRADKLPLLARVLDCTIDDLFKESEGEAG